MGHLFCGARAIRNLVPFSLFSDTTNLYHRRLWQMNNHLHTYLSDKSALTCGDGMGVLSVYTNRLTNSSLSVL